MTTELTAMSIPYMGKAKRNITDADLKAAANLRRLWEKFKAENPGISQETAGSRIEMTQSAISQYLRGAIPINLEAVLKFSALFGIEPQAIRDDFSIGDTRIATKLSLRQTVPDYDNLSPEAKDIAKAWMMLPPNRRECVRDQIFFEAAVIKLFPWFQVGRPHGETYLEFEKRVTSSVKKLRSSPAKA